MISLAFEGLEGLEGTWTGVGVFLGSNFSFKASTDPTKLVPQFLQNLSSGLTFTPQFGQKFGTILISLKDPSTFP